MAAPTPRDAVSLGREVDLRLTLIERRLSQLQPSNTVEGLPIATESQRGIAELATEWEATLWPFDPFDPVSGPTPNLTSTIMTPQRAKQMLDAFAPVVAKGPNNLHVNDVNTATETGFYKGYRYGSGSGTANTPPADGEYVFLVHNLSQSGYNSGGVGFILQEALQLDTSGSNAAVRRWYRLGEPEWPVVWGDWVPNEASTGRIGDVRFATSAELSGSSLVVVTPDQVRTLISQNFPGAASTTKSGLLRLATNAEVAAGAVSDAAVTPSTLLSRTSTAARIGLVELATDAEAIAGTDATRAVTPAALKATLPGGGATPPAPQVVALTDDPTVSSGGAWTNIPGLSISITPAFPLLVEIEVAGTSPSTPGASLRLGARTSGGLACEPETDQDGTTKSSAFTATLLNLNASGIVYIPISARKRLVLPAGVETTVTAAIWASASVTVSAPALTVTPLRWA